jgi:hypothetical protein
VDPETKPTLEDVKMAGDVEEAARPGHEPVAVVREGPEIPAEIEEEPVEEV